jgi:hypothetical protein
MAAGATLSDYARFILRGESPSRVWDSRYVRIAEAAEELCGMVTTLDGRAYPAATLADVQRASSSNDVLILIAHWSGWEIVASDFTATSGAVLERLKQAGLWDLVEPWSGSMTDLTRALNELVETGALLKRLEPTIASRPMHPLLVKTMGRDLVDELLAGAIRPGNRVELYDGQHPPDAIEQAIDAGFHGDIDLATCSSLALATLISIRRGSAVHLVHDADVIDPLACCRVIAETLRHADRQGVTYAEARLSIAERLAASARQWRPT